MDVAILGCGTIGTELATAVANGRVADARIVAVHNRSPEPAHDLAGRVDAAVVDDSLALTDHADLVVEAAGQDAVREHAVSILQTGVDLMVLSVGALGDDALREAVLGATASGGDLYVPSGAIAGLDAVKAAAVAGDPGEVTLTTRKPPAGLTGAPYVEEHDIDLAGIEEAETVFTGDARTAASAFPSNINVAMALTLAADIDPGETTVRIVADPETQTNTHAVTVQSAAGTVETRVENVPSPSNPKTSYLASLSAIEKLRTLTAAVSVGT